MHSKYEFFMKMAIEEAIKSHNQNEVPVGAIICKDEKIISRGRNLSISSNDPTSHAEINAIRNATNKINNYRLSNCTLFVTLEPCAMCYGAIIHSRVSEIVFGAFDKKTGVCGSCLNLSDSACFNHKPKVIGGILASDCSKILKGFFKEKRL